jgi:pilus assembly protein CpaC
VIATRLRLQQTASSFAIALAAGVPLLASTLTVQAQAPMVQGKSSLQGSFSGSSSPSSKPASSIPPAQPANTAVALSSADALLKLTSRSLGVDTPATRPDPAAPQASVTQIHPILLQRPLDTDHAATDHAATGRGANFSSESLNEQATHITVGRSIFIDTKRRLARVYITDPTVLDSYTAGPNEIVVTAKKAGATTLIVWDESGESKSYLVSSDLNVEMLRDSLKQALPSQAITVKGNETRVILTGTVETQAVAEQAVKIAQLYSKEVSNSLIINTARVRQVRLEVKIVEADRSKLAQFGFNFFSSGGRNPGSTTTQQYNSSLTANIVNGIKTVAVNNPLNFSLYINKFNIGATLQDLETMQMLQILAEPNITAMSGEKASFLAGGEFPFPIVQSSSTGTPVISLMFKPYGVKLEFLPIVNDDGTIDLKVMPEVSALDYANAVNISGYTIPAISTRRADTEVVLKSGQTFALAGLLDKRTTDLYAKTPGAASIPILGQLFKSKGVNHTDNELIVIVTPTLIDPVAQDIPLPPVPQQIIPMLNNNKFDKELPAGARK